MTRGLAINPSDATPIWRQIEEGLRRLVGSGALAPGSTVPSVREMAADLRVNPATVAKAYQRLADVGVFTVRRGEGTFVSASPPPVARAERLKSLRDGAIRYGSLAVTLGTACEEAVETLRHVWPKGEGR